ncbi:MAG: hypothetical protein H7099_13575 [Gemmatimonadaceae bacterium]|nr:hypothetical protein [Gemmatimonadaceae bacterium]
MKWALIGALVSTLAVGAAACTELASSPQTETAEMHALQARAMELQRGIAETKSLSPETRAALRQLTAEIRDWNARTGHDDIAVSTTRMAGAATAPAHGLSAAVAVVPSGPAPCTPCQLVTTSGNRICFLVDGDECDVLRGLTLHTCVYVCITVSPGNPPIRRG